MSITIHPVVSLILFFIVSFSYGQNAINLCGTVTNAAGIPLSGVTVKLQKKNLSTITAANGKYNISLSTDIGFQQRKNEIISGCSVLGNKIVVSTAKVDRLEASIFDIRGRRIWTYATSTSGVGSHETVLPKTAFSMQTGFLLVSIGTIQYTFKFTNIGNGIYAFSKENTPVTDPVLHKHMEISGTFPILDTLTATGQGFAMNNTICSYVYSFIDTIDFALGEPDSLSEARQQIVHRVNDYRATLGLKRLIRAKTQESCADTEAQMDYVSNKAHSAFGHCKEFAQNECPGWSGTKMLTIADNIVTGCLQSMWDEGPGTPYSAHGHYINMSNPAYSKIACGFYFNAVTKKMWAIQDFF